MSIKGNRARKDGTAQDGAGVTVFSAYARSRNFCNHSKKRRKLGNRRSKRDTIPHRGIEVQVPETAFGLAAVLVMPVAVTACIVQAQMTGAFSAATFVGMTVYVLFETVVGMRLERVEWIDTRSVRRFVVMVRHNRSHLHRSA